MGITFQNINKVISGKLIKNGLYSKNTDKNLVIVMFHGIDKIESKRYNLRFYSKDNFEKQIALFKKHCNILTHDDFANDRYSTQKPNIIITFDDGYLNNYTYALPVLEKYNAHAWYFITGIGSMDKKMLWADAVDIVENHGKEKTKVHIGGQDFEIVNKVFINKDTNIQLKKFIKQSNRPGYAEKENLIEQLLSIFDFTKDNNINDYWQLMDEGQIAETGKSRVITIGSHGFYHNNLGSLANADAVAEVLKSKVYLENILQKEVRSIGFPDGSYTELLNHDLFHLGFNKQFVVNYQFSDEGKKNYVYDRFGLYSYMGNEHQLLHKILHLK